MTALAQTDRAIARERVLKAAVDWVYDQSCSLALAELEDAVTDLVGPELPHPTARSEAEVTTPSPAPEGAGRNA